MPNKKISLMDAAAELTGAELLEVVQSGDNFKLAVDTLKDFILGDADALVYKGAIDCSGDPNYPAADAGHVYIVSVAGKIGGGSGEDVQVGDLLICNTDESASGDQATVGANWNIIPATSTGGTDRSTVTSVSSASGVVTLNYALGDYFTLTLTENVTSWVISNPPGSGKGFTLMVQITQDSTPRTVAKPGTTAGGAALDVSTGSGAVDVLAITSFDNGSTLRSSIGKDFS